MTFATGKGILVSEQRSCGRSHESVGVKAGKVAAPLRSRFTTATNAVQAAAPQPAETDAAATEDVFATDATALATPSGGGETYVAPGEHSSPQQFDPAASSAKFLRLEGPRTVACHTNAGQASQGTAFLKPPVRAGEAATLRVRCVEKPGRMRYFIGCAPARFDVDAGQAAIQASGYCLENLKAAPHSPGRPCASSAGPCFHTGSEVTLEIDLRSAPGRITWRVDSTGVEHTVAVDRATRELHAFVSLYNRGALFDVEVAPFSSDPAS